MRMRLFRGAGRTGGSCRSKNGQDIHGGLCLRMLVPVGEERGVSRVQVGVRRQRRHGAACIVFGAVPNLIWHSSQNGAWRASLSESSNPGLSDFRATGDFPLPRPLRASKG